MEASGVEADMVQVIMLGKDKEFVVRQVERPSALLAMAVLSSCKLHCVVRTTTHKSAVLGIYCRIRETTLKRLLAKSNSFTHALNETETSPAQCHNHVPCA
jgi:hypothetical protein